MPAKDFQRQTPSLVVDEHSSLELATMVELKQDIANIALQISGVSQQVAKVAKDNEQTRFALFGHPIEGETQFGRIPSLEAELSETKKRMRVLEEAAILGAGKKDAVFSIGKALWALITFGGVILGYYLHHIWG